MIKTTKILFTLLWFMSEVLNRTRGASSIWSILSKRQTDRGLLSTSTTKLTDELESYLPYGRVETKVILTRNGSFSCNLFIGYNFSNIVSDFESR